MNPCDVNAEPSDLVHSENRSGPSSEPWGLPVSGKQGLDKEPCKRCNLSGMM